MATHYVVVNARTGKFLISNSRLPIYWKRNSAKQQANRYPGHTVAKIDSDVLESIIEPFKDSNLYKIEQFCRDICTVYWNVSFDWVIDGSRAERRPIMKMVLYMLIKKRYPELTLKSMAKMMNHKDHAGPKHSLDRAKRWHGVSDPVFIKYYEPVKHLLYE